MKLDNKFFIQFITLLILITIAGVFLNNLLVNLIRSEIGFSLKWLVLPTGFALSEHALPYDPSDTYLWVLIIGWLNSLKVILSGLILATVIGTLAGFLRISNNIFLRSLSTTYIALVRQIPLLLQLLFWYFIGFLNISDTPLSLVGSVIMISNQGVQFLGIKFSAEFSALLIGLSVFTGAYIAEIVRGGLNSVIRGQWEAFRSLGFNEIRGVQLIIIPQALPAILPALTSQYLNLAKNSTLAIAIGYADLYAISDTTITQTGRAVEGFLLLLVIFLSFNLIISYGMDIMNNFFLKKNN